MRKKLWKPFTIMVVPHTGEQVRSIAISKTWILSSAAFLLLIGASGGYFIYKFTEYRNTSAEYSQYKTETEQIRHDYDTLSTQTETVREKLDTLQQLENDLRSKSGLPPLQEPKPEGNGQGGTLQSRSGFNRHQIIINKDAVSQLEKSVDQRVQSVQYTLQAVNQQDIQRKAEEQRKQYQAAHTPSIWPTGYRNVSSDFGYRKDPFSGFYALHTGIDITGAYGSPIVATADGTVEIAGWDGGYGISVLINHGNGISTRYGHMSSVSAKVYQTVKKGETIGLMGSTGRSTGTHVHYEVIVNGTVVNPEKYLP